VAAVDEMRGDGEDTARYLSGYARRLDISDGDRAVDVLLPLWAGRSVGLWRSVVPESVDGPRLLADNGLHLGIVSNSDGTVAEQLLAHGIAQLGDGAGVKVLVIVDSALVGIAKPRPSHLCLCARGARARPGRGRLCRRQRSGTTSPRIVGTA
jgi:putative hydrolase of the HAD superfamily